MHGCAILRSNTRALIYKLNIMIKITTKISNNNHNKKNNFNSKLFLSTVHVLVYLVS